MASGGGNARASQDEVPKEIPGSGGRPQSAEFQTIIMSTGHMTEKGGYKVLVVDDEEDVAGLVEFHLIARGFKVETLTNPREALSIAQRFQPDLFILDVMMPDLTGIQICRSLRGDKRFSHTPIVFLTARAEEADRILGLEVGADDYICKPFSPQELVLRVQSILRRAGKGAEDVGSSHLRAGGLTIDSERHEVLVEGRAVELTATEFRLLSLLVERKGRVQSREQLLTNVWNYDEEMETRTVDTHIRRIREKLGAASGVIETIRGVGYRVSEKQ